MRTVVSRFVVLLVFSGCAGAPAPVAPTAAEPPAAAATGPAAAAAAGTPGPGTTTAAGLQPNVAGTKLTPLGGDAGAPHVHTSEPGRSLADIRAIMVAHRDDARACYDKALAAHPGIEGNLDVRWTIDPTGKVSEASVDSSRSDILEPTVGECVIGIVKKIQFAASPKGFETKASYPFNFHPRPKRNDAGSP